MLKISAFTNTGGELGIISVYFYSCFMCYLVVFYIKKYCFFSVFLASFIQVLFFKTFYKTNFKFLAHSIFRWQN